MSDGIPLAAIPHRNPTLESGIDGARQLAQRRIGTNNDQSDDKIQNLLDSRLVTSSNAKSSSHFYRLKKDYARIKDRHAEHRLKNTPKRFSPSNPSSGEEEIFSCDKLFSYWLIAAPGIAAESCNGTMNIQAGSTFSEWACRIAAILGNQQPNTLQLVSMTESPEEELTGFLFSSWQFFLATVYGRLGTVYHIPVRVLQATIADYWGMEMAIMPETAPEGALDPSSSSRPRPLGPPSIRPAKSTEEHLVYPMKIVWGQDSTRPGNLDPSRGDHEILLTWKRRITIFESDLAMYIWEYHKRMPQRSFTDKSSWPPVPVDQQG
ncbi:hypothetical protein PG995_006626 [Apiospora arundinis]